MRMGGHSSRFGIDAEQIPAAIAAITGAPHLTLRGLHVYGGTQCFDAEAFIAHAHALATHAASWERELDVRFAELDLGGGFGVATFAGDPVFRQVREEFYRLGQSAVLMFDVTRR